jgi:hypothetical protein
MQPFLTFCERLLKRGQFGVGQGPHGLYVVLCHNAGIGSHRRDGIRLGATSRQEVMVDRLTLPGSSMTVTRTTQPFSAAARLAIVDLSSTDCQFIENE